MRRLIGRRAKSYIHSYGQTLQTQGAQRIHGQMRYDENYHLQENSYYLKDMVRQEKETWAQVEEQLLPLIDSYQSASEKRVDPRHGDLPEEYDDYEYYGQAEMRESVQSSIMYRRDRETKEVRELFDIQTLPNLSRVFRESVQMVKMVVSDDHELIAYGIDKRNDEQVEFYFKDSRGYLKDRLRDSSDLSFMLLNKGVFYLEYDHNRRNSRIKTRLFGQRPSSDRLIYEEEDPAYSLGMHGTKDKKYVVVTSSNKSVTEVRVIEKSSGQMSLVLDRSSGHNMYLNHDGEKWVCLRDKGGQESTVEVRESLSQPWQVVYHCGTHQSIQEIDVFKGVVVLYIQSSGKSMIQIIDTSQQKGFPVRQVQLDTEISRISPGINQSLSPRAIRFHLETPFQYNLIYEYDLRRQQVNLLEGFRLLGPAFDASQFRAYQIEVPAEDGTPIPVTLVHKKGIKLDRSHRLLLHVYGFYGLPCESAFSIVNLQALQSGWIIAYAHVRGGSEKGVTWHEQGRQEHKHKSFSDYISVAEGLIAQGYTHNSLLAGHGSSAGAAIVAQGVNTHPHLFQAVVLNVPFLEVLGTLLDKSKALVVSDHEEWGDPGESLETYHRVQELCPYENLQHNNYPSVLLVVGEHDFRSPLYQVMKYVKRLRDRRQRKDQRGEVYVNIQSTGHNGGVGADCTIREYSVQYALLDHLLVDNNKEVTVIRPQETQYEKINED